MYKIYEAYKNQKLIEKNTQRAQREDYIPDQDQIIGFFCFAPFLSPGFWLFAITIKWKEYLPKEEEEAEEPRSDESCLSLSFEKALYFRDKINRQKFNIRDLFPYMEGMIIKLVENIF